ncbi:hypothetical protein J4526_07510 [Desulfurococcaceae archaeon MEX13E-LK6-19]|nr:hypothetical protein J4526_07510 [Desulfurococcaceae archaeon MEX13E-LK6-19]
MSNRFPATVVLIVLIIASMGLVSTRVYTLNTSLQNYLDDNTPSSIEVYVVPSNPRDLTPVLILVHINGSYTGYPVLKVFSEINLSMGLQVEPTYNPGYGNITLVVNTYLDGSPIGNVYVEVWEESLLEPGLLELVASGFTNSSGSETFYLYDIGGYYVRCYYDRDEDGVYEYFSEDYVPVYNNTRVNITLTTIIDHLGLRDFLPKPVVREIPFRPLGDSWFISGFPGLPYKVINTSASWLSADIPFIVTVKGVANCSIIVGDKTYNVSLEVNSSALGENIPPLVLAQVSNTLEDPGAYKETLGLAPRGWSLPDSTPLNISIVVVDDKGYSGIRDLVFEYCVNNESWATAPVTNDTIMDYLDNITRDFNKMIHDINTVLGIAGVNETIPHTSIPFFMGIAEIPGQQPGVFVEFRARAVDEGNNTIVSPMGLYYVYNSTGERVLVIDPHVKLWLIKENYRQLRDMISINSKFSFPSSYMGKIESANKLAELLCRSFVVFHNWHYVGEKYSVTIVYPGESIDEYLRSVEPRVVILSNLYLGLNAGFLFNWDLSSIDCGGKSALECILDYVREHHAGLIATHGTLSDWMLWVSCETRIKIGSRGHIGSGIEDIASSRRLASALGLIWLPLWEYARDKIAEELCEMGRENLFAYSLGLAIGSTPLQVPYVPWSGELELTREGKALGWSLPSEPIVIPNPYTGINSKYKAYTQVGWQLGAPSAIAYTAINHTGNAKGYVTGFYNRVYEIVENATGRRLRENLTGYLDKALDHEIRDLRRGLARAEIVENSIKALVDIPGLGAKLEVNITIPEDVYRRVTQLMPLKIVALSPNGAAGITVYDVYWDPYYGYRAVYFSFEVEAGVTNSSKVLLQQAIEWASEWKFVLEATDLINDEMRAPKEVVDAFEDLVWSTRGGTILYDSAVLLPEEGVYKLALNITEPTNITIVIAHPWSSKVNITVSENAIVLNKTTYNNVTKIDIYVEKPGYTIVNMSSDPASTYDQAYLYASTLEAPETVTVYVTTTVTETQTETVTETTTETMTKTETVTETTPVPQVSTTTTTQTETKLLVSTTTITQTISTTPLDPIIYGLVTIAIIIIAVILLQKHETIIKMIKTTLRQT